MLSNKTILFREKLSKCHNNEYEHTGEFINSRTRTTFVHKTCGTSFETTPESALAKNRKFGICPKCVYEQRKVPNTLTTEKVISRLKEIYPNNEFELLGEVVNSVTPTKFIHNVCGNTFESIPNPVLYRSTVDGKGMKFCPCCKDNKTSTIDEFKKEVSETTQGEFEVLSESYTSNKTYLEFRHNTCGTTFLMRPNNFRSGQRCAHCAGIKSKTHQEFLDQFYSIPTNREFDVITEFNGNKSPITIRHRECGTEKVLKTAKSLCSGSTNCEHCSPKSMGEFMINRYLKSKNITFEREKTFEGCKYKKPLRFDFFIPDIGLLIEFDGYQHFREFGFKNSNETLELIQIRDNIKNEFVKARVDYLSLIRIRYDQDVISILDDIFENEEIPENVFVIQ